MSEHYRGFICFGGKISREQFDKIVSLLNDETMVSENDIINALEDDGSFEYENAAYGCFESVEKYCQEQSIPYDRKSDAYLEYSAENAYFRPGQEEVITCTADSDGYPMCDMGEVNHILKEYSDEEGNPAKGINIKAMFNALRLLVVADNIPDLEELEIGE